MVVPWINITMTRTYLGLLEQKIAEYASDDDDWDDISHIDRQQLLPEYQEFFDKLLERGNWASTRQSDGRTVYYHTVDMYPNIESGTLPSVASRLIAMVEPDSRGRACIWVSYRHYFDVKTYSRRSTESKMFTPETIHTAMAYVETLEQKCKTGFSNIVNEISNRRFWTSKSYEPDLYYCTIDLYPETWGVQGSKLAVRFKMDKRGLPILVVSYIKNPYKTRGGKVDSRKIFDETNIQQAMPYIEQMEARCRQYHQFRD